MHTKHPAIRPHATTAGVWLIPDTDQGRALMAHVPSPRRARPARTWITSPHEHIRCGAALGMACLALALSAGMQTAALLIDTAGSPSILLAAALLPAVLLLLIVGVSFGLQIPRQRQRDNEALAALADSGIAVPLPKALRDEDLDELGPVSRASAKRLLWEAGREGLGDQAARTLILTHNRARQFADLERLARGRVVRSPHS